jgi:hypothetical protein
MSFLWYADPALDKTFGEVHQIVNELKRDEVEDDSDDEGIDEIMGKFIFKNKTP